MLCSKAVDRSPQGPCKRPPFRLWENKKAIMESPNLPRQLLPGIQGRGPEGCPCSLQVSHAGQPQKWHGWRSYLEWARLPSRHEAPRQNGCNKKVFPIYRCRSSKGPTAKRRLHHVFAEGNADLKGHASVPRQRSRLPDGTGQKAVPPRGETVLRDTSSDFVQFSLCPCGFPTRLVVGRLASPMRCGVALPLEFGMVESCGSGATVLMLKFTLSMNSLSPVAARTIWFVSSRTTTWKVGLYRHRRRPLTCVSATSRKP